MKDAAQDRLLQALHDSAVQAVILYGPSASDNTALLDALLDQLTLTVTLVPIPLSLHSGLEQPRTEFFQQLARQVIAATGHAHMLLDTFSPTHFHTDFLGQILAELPPTQQLLFVVDGIDFQNRAQLSKLNNLLLPLLRRLARVARLKFLLAVDTDEPTQIHALLHPIFTTVEEVEWRIPQFESETDASDDGADEPNARQTNAEETDPAVPADATLQPPTPPTRRRTLLLWLLLLIILALVANIYLLLTLLQRLS